MRARVKGEEARVRSTAPFLPLSGRYDRVPFTLEPQRGSPFPYF
jgi:hypothetical protein